MSAEQIKPGYKRTEVGVIPEDWVAENLAKVADVKTGPFGSSLHERDYVQDGTPIITVEHLGDFGVEHINLPMISDVDRQRLQAYQLVEGDIVFSRVGSVDRNALICKSEAGWLFSGRLLRVRPNRSKTHPPFLSFQFHSEPFKASIRSVAVGQTMASLNTKILNRMGVALPPITEQRAIAAVLSDVDALLTKLNQLITKKRDLKQAAMQQLLTGQTRLPGFSGEWEVKRIDQICSLRTERVDPRTEGAQEFCIELEHIEPASGRLLGSSIASEQASLKTKFKIGDVLFGKLRAYQRKHWIARLPGVCSTEIWVLVSNAEFLTPEFLYHLVSTDDFIEAASTAYGTHMPRSDWKVVRQVQVALPSLDEQTAIATVLSDMDTELAALEARRDKTRALKQGMMQELLTGRIRLA